jgi:hypothetical protein
VREACWRQAHAASNPSSPPSAAAAPSTPPAAGLERNRWPSNAVAARLDYGRRYPTPNNPVRRSFGSIEVKKRALELVSWAPTRTDDPLPRPI